MYPWALYFPEAAFHSHVSSLESTAVGDRAHLMLAGLFLREHVDRRRELEAAGCLDWKHERIVGYGGGRGHRNIRMGIPLACPHIL